MERGRDAPRLSRQAPGARRLCNPYTVGADSWATAVDLGLRADAEIQLRACDYADESSCVYEGVEYDVEKVTRTGELVRLQLGRRASNG